MYRKFSEISYTLEKQWKPQTRCDPTALYISLRFVTIISTYL
jgi:hypothetical protein